MIDRGLSFVRAAARATTFVTLAACVIWFGVTSGAVAGQATQPSPFTVPDSIEMTRLVPARAGIANADQLAYFSPDGAHFVIHARRGDLARNVNRETLLLFRSSEVTNAVGTTSAPPAPIMLAVIDVRQDWGQLSSIQWINNREVAFLAEGDNGRPQVFVVDLAASTPSQLTQDDFGVASFAISGDLIVYYAHTGNAPQPPQVQPVERKTLPELLLPSIWQNWDTTPLALHAGSRKTGQRAVVATVRASHLNTYRRNIWISPSGRYLITFARAVNWPAYWRDYAVPYGDLFGWTPDRMESDPTAPSAVSRTRYQLTDLRTGETRPLLDAPDGLLSGTATPADVFWSEDETFLIVSNTFLPFKGETGDERRRRQRGPAIAEVDLRSGGSRAIAWEPTITEAIKSGEAHIEPIVTIDWQAQDGRLLVTRRRTGGGLVRNTYTRSRRGWAAGRPELAAASVPQLQIEQRQTLEERPKVYAVKHSCACSRVLLDPNPQIEQRTLVPGQLRHWTDSNKIAWRGLLLLPPGHDANRHYPLVIQTHGLQSSEFLIDGPYGGTSAFAAQALANAGIIVLQVEDNAAALTTDVREASLFAEGYRSGATQLIDEGLVDSQRVGLIAFSRTGLGAVQLLAESPEFLAAVDLADASDHGYVTHSLLLANYPDESLARQFTKSAGGSPESMGYDKWFGSMALYKLPRARAAVRIETMGPASLLSHWETYAVLRNAGRAVDLVYFPEGSHVLQKPHERLASQEGSVDWFRFWLQGHEDPAPKKAEQYRHWRGLRDNSQPRSPSQ